MRFKKPLAVLFAVCLALSALTMAASAANEVTIAGTTYTVISPKSIELTGEDVKLDDRGKDLSVLYDGDVNRSVESFDKPGLVMVANQQVVDRKAKETPVNVTEDQNPTASFEMDFGSKVSFDTAYIAIFYQPVGIGEPADNCVTVETSEDGNVWSPVGDGKFYYSLPKCPDYNADVNKGNGWPFVGEVAVPLGETVEARYVRYSFKFGTIPTEPTKYHWTFYTNVYEFMDFSEMGVATYKDGRKQKQLTAKDVADYPALPGDWFVDLSDKLEVWTIATNGDMKITKKTYDKAAYLADATVEPTETDEDMGYYVQDQTTFLLFEDGAYDEYTYAVTTEGNLSLTLDGDETLLLSAANFKKANPSESSGTSSGTSSATSSTSSDASSAASSAATSSAASSAASSSKAPTSASSAASSNADDGGSSMWLVIAIVAAVVVVVAVVVIVVVRKKKK